MTANEFGSNLEQLTRRLKTEDSHYATILKVIQIFYWIFIPVFAIMTVREYSDSHNVIEIFSGASLILSYLTFALIFRKYYKEYKYVDYSLPTLEMLKKAAYRYQPFQKRALWVLVGIAFMDVGLTIEWLDENTTILIIQISLLGGILVGFIVGLFIWYIKYKPLRDDALKLVREIEE